MFEYLQRVEYFVLIAECSNLYNIDEPILSSKHSARFILHTKNAIFRPIP